MASSKAPAANNARNHKSNKTNTRNNVKLNNNDDNSGAGSLSVGSGPSVASNAHSSTNNSHNTTSTTTTQAQPPIVKLTPAPSSTGSARTSSPVVNVTIMKKYRDEPSTSRTPDMPYASVPTAGGLKFSYEQQVPAGLVINTNTALMQSALKESPPSSPGSEASARKRRKGVNSLTPQPSPHAFIIDHKEKDSKMILQNGAIPITTHHMLGNQLNPNSSVAKNMVETLNMEIEAHSIYTHEPQQNLVGPQYPGRKESVMISSPRLVQAGTDFYFFSQAKPSSSSSTSTTTSSGPASLTSMLSGASSSNGAPQSLEQLLERQWEQGSQFLMEQAQHFDSKQTFETPRIVTKPVPSFQLHRFSRVSTSLRSRTRDWKTTSIV